MNTQVGILKNRAMFDRIASYANIQLGSLTPKRFHKCEAVSLNTHAYTKLSLVKRDKVSFKGFLSPVGFAIRE